MGKKPNRSFVTESLKRITLNLPTEGFSEGQNTVRRLKILIGTCCATLRKKSQCTI